MQPLRTGAEALGGQPVEAVQGLAEKAGSAPKHGVNGKYLIIQAARMLAQQEKAGKGDSQTGVFNSPQRQECL